MRDAKMIQELAFNNTNRYEPNTRVHINLVCLNCGAIIDIENKTLEAEVNKISKNRMFSITSHRFDVYGICRKCEKADQD